jgi:hypothetical protein
VSRLFLYMRRVLSAIVLFTSYINKNDKRHNDSEFFGKSSTHKNLR